MSETAKHSSDERRKRVQMLKRLIVSVWILALILPIVLCIILFDQVNRLNKTVDSLSERLRVFEAASVRDKETLDAEYTGTTGVGFAMAGDAKGDRQDSTLQEDAGQEEHLHQVYLTFDDGPSIYTDDILDILDRYGIKATFFVVGKEDEDSKEAIKQIVERGHTLGMHSYSHKYSELYASVESFSEDFEKLQSFLYDITGILSKVYRFPGGSSNTVSRVEMEDCIRFLDEKGVTFYDWNIASGDGGSGLLSVSELVKNSTKDVEKWHTAIVLMHDSADKRTTVEALPIIIENLLEMEDTVLLPITEETPPIQHIHTTINEQTEG